MKEIQGSDGCTYRIGEDYRPSWKSGNPRMVVQCPSPHGFKTRAACLAEAMPGSRYSRRAGGYLLSKRSAWRFVQLFEEGYDANFISGELIPPKGA